ncbi:MAG: hypothetical protein ABI432_10915 [Flavobacteriales bacterium]
MNDHGHPTEGERIGGTLAQDHSASSSWTSSSVKELAPGLMRMHMEHTLWLNSLRFYREEIYIFNGHLEQFVRTTAQRDQMENVEHFQNKFLRETEVIDELAHAIKQHEKQLQRGTGSGHEDMHADLLDRMATYERLYTELKMEFRSWLVANP